MTHLLTSHVMAKVSRTLFYSPPHSIIYWLPTTQLILYQPPDHTQLVIRVYSDLRFHIDSNARNCLRPQYISISRANHIKVTPLHTVITIVLMNDTLLTTWIWWVILQLLIQWVQYCSSDSCCINRRSYEPLRNHRHTTCSQCVEHMYTIQLQWKTNNKLNNKMS